MSGLKLRVTWYYDPDEWGKVTKVEVESMSDWAKELLAGLARDLVESGVMHAPEKDSPFHEICVKALSDVFESRLLGLLDAGEACASAVEAECDGSDPDSCDKRWRAAKAKASRP